MFTLNIQCQLFVCLLGINVSCLFTNEDEDSMEEWDLTIQQILPHIDGVTHVAKIANQAGVDASLVKAAIQNLHYHSVVAILPIFMYQNVYCCEPQIAELRNNAELREEFMEFIQVDEPEPPTLPVDQLEEQAEGAEGEVEDQQDENGDDKVAGETTTVAELEAPPVKFKDIYKYEFQLFVYILSLNVSCLFTF